jgi:hypothetical protein
MAHVKNTFKISIIFILSISSKSAFSQTDEMFVSKSYLILASTKNINEAFTIAKTSAKKTGFIFQDNKLKTDKTIGATFPKDTCDAFAFEYPCYVARGRYDDGSYISVEYSDAYEGFTKGYFIVIASSYFKENTQIKLDQKKVKPFYPQAYIKSTKVYIGCMH